MVCGMKLRAHFLKEIMQIKKVQIIFFSGSKQTHKQKHAQIIEEVLHEL